MGTPGPARFSRFQNSAIYWTPFIGPQETSSLAYVLSLDKFHIYQILNRGSQNTEQIKAALNKGADALAAVHRPKRLSGNYLNIRLVGTRSNRDALGSRCGLAVASNIVWSQGEAVSGVCLTNSTLAWRHSRRSMRWRFVGPVVTCNDLIGLPSTKPYASAKGRRLGSRLSQP